MEQGTFDFAREPSPAPIKLCECGCGEAAPIATRSTLKRGAVKGQPLKFIRGHYRPPVGRPNPGRRKLSVETGQRIGHSVVIDPDVPIFGPTGKRTSRGARLRCDCGAEFDRRLMVLFRDPDVTSCGCASKAFADRTGQRFGRLTAVRPIENRAQVRGKTVRWLCLCDCGEEVIVSGYNLQRGHSKSCGCMKRGRGQDYAKGEAACNKTLRSYRRNAQTRGIPWDLAKDDFKRLTLQDCHYCGAVPSMTTKGAVRGGDYVYNGLDRVDNALGYAAGNVVTCCKICNHAKRDMPYDDFLAWIARLTEYHFFHPEIMPSRLLTVRT